MSDNPLHITSQDIPTFNCLVYVCSVDGGVRARVANLDGIEITASDERTALSKIVPAFKAKVQQILADQESIPWIDPPLQATEEEQTRFIPIHL